MKREAALQVVVKACQGLRLTADVPKSDYPKLLPVGKNASTFRWVAIAIIYAAFRSWHGGNGSPLTAEEVDYYVERATEVMGPDASERFGEFASTVNGKELVMLNLNKYRERPTNPDGRKANMS